jgi:hypothetical protein
MRRSRTRFAYGQFLASLARQLGEAGKDALRGSGQAGATSYGDGKSALNAITPCRGLRSKDGRDVMNVAGLSLA